MLVLEDASLMASSTSPSRTFKGSGSADCLLLLECIRVWCVNGRQWPQHMQLRQMIYSLMDGAHLHCFNAHSYMIMAPLRMLFAQGTAVAVAAHRTQRARHCASGLWEYHTAGMIKYLRREVSRR